MSFFTSMLSNLQTIITFIGAGLGGWGIINLLEGYGNDNPGAKSQGLKQLMAGAGVVIFAQAAVPALTTLLGS